MPRLIPRMRIRLSGRFALTLGGVLAVLLVVALALFMDRYQEAAIAEKKQQLHHYERGVVYSLRSIMRTGLASKVHQWLAEIRKHPDVKRVAIVRPDGQLAFRDLATLHKVNAHLGAEVFDRDPLPDRRAEGVPEELLDRVMAGEQVARVDSEAGELVQLYPLEKKPPCQRCHAYTDREILGAVWMEASLVGAQERLAGSYGRVVGMGVLVTLLAGLVVFALVRLQIIRPLAALVSVTRRITAGDLDARANMGNRDEIGELAGSLNHMADALQQSLEEMRSLITRSRTGMMVVDEEGTILFVNPAAESLLNRTADQLVGSPLGVPLVGGEATEINVYRPAGDLGVAELSVHPIEWEQQPGFLVTFHDVTQRKQAEEAAQYRALHDELTGLPNRPHFQERLERAVADAAVSDSGLAVLFVDLDRFKEVNDSLGHAAGDQLLRVVAQRLREAVRSSDLVARLSGDEFTTLLPGVNDRRTAMQVAWKVLEAIREPLTIYDHDIVPQGAVGVSLYPADGEDAETLLRRADTAMYSAKEGAGDPVRAYSPDLGEAASERFQMERALRRALNNGELYLVYQPQVTLPGEEPVSVESLMRWADPEEGLISPGRFIPYLEATGLIREAGDWALRQACQDLRRWLDAGASVERVWVNLSAYQLATPDLVGRLRTILSEAGVEARHFGLELTESSVADNIDQAIEVMSALRAEGIALAMDDFGKGYSALTFLRRLPLDMVKIDRAFVQGLPQDQENAGITRAIIAMGHSLGQTVLAEGVEETEEADFLAGEGCRYGQGFLFAHPMRAEDIADIFPRGG